MQEQFLQRDRIDWQRLRREAFAYAEGAQSSVETYAAIRFALAQLGDHHSLLQLTPALAREETSRKVTGGKATPAATQGASRQPSPFQARRAPEGSIIETAARPVARIVVPLFAGPDVDGFATKFQSIVADPASIRTVRMDGRSAW